ncbi:TlpA family protein disulfide reductase [Chitinophaga sp. Ak27]|uniref:TlpA family protein disulfide reductase n=1 Tax=Chitinophaga sp. Ak27 TaxID=2726116 RepID=UPI00145EE043|nr:redoxin domain-containing protein [Chitinophaga sp. Ak27]NLU96231.1 redoxin domain-containing protein [Chitinophaga sp. Ak27]
MNPHPLKQQLGLCCILLLLTSGAAAQTTAVITGKVADRHVPQVSLTYWTDPGISPAITQDTSLIPDSFYFRIPLPVGAAVFFYADAGTGYSFYGLIRSGDSICMKMRADSLALSGNGAQVCRALYNAKREQERIPVPVISDAGKLAAAFRQQLEVAGQVLNHYRDSMDMKTWQVIRAHIYGETAAKLAGTFWKLSPDPDSTLEDRQLLFYKTALAPAWPDIVPSDVTATSIRYLGYLLQKAEVDYFVQHRYECSNQAIYEWIKTHYSGRLRDKLLAHELMLGFAAGNQQEEQENCVRDYLQIVQDDACKQAVARLYGRSRKGISRGSVAPPFTFTDQQGKQVGLQQFSGKVVLLHFYSGSDPLLHALAEIKNCFDETTVTFVNICCDGNTVKDLPGWLLRMDEQHRDVLTQYNISRYPTLIVVGKNGKIFATRPPDPAVDHGTALANIIYEALSQ